MLSEISTRIEAESRGRAACMTTALLTALTVLGCSGEGSAADTAVSAQTVPESDRATLEVRRPPANRAWVIFGTDTIVAEIARTSDERAQGLMYRDELPDGTGMLFVFEDVQIRSFWMANTYVPLDIAYINVSYVIVDIQQMEPLVTDSYPSAAPAMFALEVAQGWFAKHGVVVGDQAQIEFGIQVGR